MKHILLHSCCAPCAIYVIERLKELGFKPTVFYYNPNIHPAEEYQRRFSELKKYLEKNKIKYLEGEYQTEEWFKLVRGHEKDPERGERCKICYWMRLKKAAEKAKELNCQYFASTLSISPHKDALAINQIGQQLAEQYDLKFYAADWKKDDGYKKACQLSHQHNFYRQNYCGCIFSQNMVK